MGFWHSMSWRTEGIRVTAPVQWRQYDGMVSVLWEAESQAGASGYYLADDPRIMFFFNDVSPNVRISNLDNDLTRNSRPMARAVYVPAGIPLWTGSRRAHSFSHLNLHLHKDRVLRYLAPSVGSSVAQSALRRPVELQNVAAIDALAKLLADEIRNPSKHEVYAESLIGSIVAGLLDIPANREERADGRLTQAQMNRLVSHVDALGDYRMSVADMAAVVGLSESWFANVFKQTTGTTPWQWQLSKRIELSKQLLGESDLPVASIAAQLGFSDQAHLTKVFRQIVGETPAAWRRMQQFRQS
ncbi:helix-turn-helix domain-containing protein [Ensifer adhaerens]|jgi:AraC family transcriptional regulator|uniref:AraC family transcriptional regulator n=1 Tax=Ensifer adhaerens TaxID=106592 RepID=A0A9Q9DEC2_ENSAD|nr:MULTISPECIES: AraC family transcriptional regulator [Ensifer]KQX52345.1 AraC family transcriptional regulator [Ensifer sp. Root1298]KQX85547.1 AraC family transcriptional regulator [Ensifer sp. Root1312]KRC24555.1 AraC family transcriptional regulator [Ensifer sp. Root74]KRD76207.1 AraC family transcriptional regulator [Ensifer sp. Root954]MBD9498667.1 helix-turn-helix transcriptional regulator [Ensifer sp. ENS01]